MIPNDLLTVIEISDTHIKLLQARGQLGAREIVHADICRIEQYTDEFLASALIRMSASCKINDDALTLVIPRRLVILKQLTLPSQSPDEIRRMVGLQLGNHMPYSRDDVVFDFHILEKEANGYSRIVVVVVHREVVTRHLRILQKARLNPHRIGVSSLGLRGWHNFQEGIRKNDSRVPTLLISVDHSQTEICFLRNKQLCFSRSIPLGARDLNDEQMDAFLEQIGLTWGTYKKGQWGAEIRKICLICELAQTDLIKARMAEYYKLPLEQWAPWDKVPCVKDFDPAALAFGSEASPAAILGFLLEEKESAIELMPQEIKMVNRTKVFRVVLLRFLFLAGLTVLLAGVALGLGLYHELSRLKEVRKELARNHPKVMGAEKRMALVDLFKSKISGRILFAEVFDDLSRLSPADIVLNSLAFDQKGVLTILGSASTGASVNVFQNNLVNSERFKDVTLEYVTKRRRFDSESTEFKIVCKIFVKKEGAR